jgi:hypothetical protein
MSKDQFPVLVFKNTGPHQRAGGSYDHKVVESVEELDAALADGWYATLPEAIAEDKAVVAKEPAPTPATSAKAPSAQAKAKSAPAQPWAKE